MTIGEQTIMSALGGTPGIVAEPPIDSNRTSAVSVRWDIYDNLHIGQRVG